MVYVNEDGKSSQSQNALESAPLLSNQNSKIQYNGTDHHPTAEDVIESQWGDEPALLALARTSSYPLGVDVEPNLLTIPPSTNDGATSAGGLESAVQGDGSTDYASRFINVSPVRFWCVFGGIMMGSTSP